MHDMLMIKKGCHASPLMRGRELKRDFVDRLDTLDRSPLMRGRELKLYCARRPVPQWPVAPYAGA